MPSSVEVHRAAHEAFNQRDWERMRSLLGDGMSYSDRPRALEISSADGFLAWVQDWATGMSDAAVTEPEYLDAGEWSIARFRGRGTNDGPLGPAQATGKQMDLWFCELLRIEGGRVMRGEIYYDAMTMLTQFGVVQVPAPA